MPKTSGWFFFITYRQHVKSVFVQLSTLFRGLHAFSTCAENDTNFPIQSAICSAKSVQNENYVSLINSKTVLELYDMKIHQKDIDAQFLDDMCF